VLQVKSEHFQLHEGNINKSHVIVLLNTSLLMLQL